MCFGKWLLSLGEKGPSSGHEGLTCFKSVVTGTYCPEGTSFSDHTKVSIG